MFNKVGSLLTKILTTVKTSTCNSIEAVDDAMDHRKAVRRLIILFISLVWLWLLQNAIRMYTIHGTLDGQFTNLCMAVTAMVGTCYAFYFTGRVKETEHQKDPFLHE